MRSSFRHWVLSIKGEKLPTIVAIWLYFMHNMRSSFRHWILSIKDFNLIKASASVMKYVKLIFSNKLPATDYLISNTF
ncbi:unnamed protein product [Adineta steineri]|uniref:Uncharacterized protein n=1 Tax=Adineta steineri TaxID=433720 RepID=A0A820DF17_9BILA|nr:unnamed protein product [Adineta steineri]